MGRPIQLIDVPVQSGARRRGCVMGPDALRTAGMAEVLTDLGYGVSTASINPPATSPDGADTSGDLHAPEACAAWIAAIQAYDVPAGALPIFLGGDHLLAAGVVPAMASRSDRPQFVLWLDAHSDIHTPATTTSGNLHGTPVAYFTGAPEFEGVFPPPRATVDPGKILMLGLRSVDPDEKAALVRAGVVTADMRTIDEHGIAPPLRRFLDEVRVANGDLHVSLDVDFLDPSIAPAVGTTVPGGATFREAHLVMEMLHDSGLVTSLDIAELNPFLDERGRTTSLIVDLIASLFGKAVLDRPTRRG
ncbi:arginase [Jannaschia pagri]|uniref:Arginase n=1 Tax=Jannaschia pagri TaxID=2829797 RepID=A0ABQ4NQL1_9RHOB|nr:MULTISPECIES: arginase [unclassified Jannaschia]GIT92570.1 arginase [Jannaschia sp. AI_61]GIT96570.1 arginase [Jannaschia sp. AI_62]